MIRLGHMGDLRYCSLPKCFQKSLQFKGDPTESPHVLVCRDVSSRRIHHNSTSNLGYLRILANSAPIQWCLRGRYPKATRCSGSGAVFNAVY